MKRRDFLTDTAVAGAVVMCGTQPAAAQNRADGGSGMPQLVAPEKPAELNLCLQWSAIPGGEMAEKLDFLEANGFGAVELPSGKWLFDNADSFTKAMTRRKLFVATACGPSDFSYAEADKRDAEVAKFLPQLEVLGSFKSVGLIVCPARGKPGLAFPELREDFVTNTGKRLAQHAAKHGTSIVLEPLQRGETPFLRQVADGAAMARDIGPGATVMGDFWHMSKEETSFMGAFISGGKLLSHVHIASLKDRKVPGTDGDADNYVDGFKGLKLIGYRGAVSMECGFPKDSDHKQLILNMVKLLRKQWAMA
jgi:sugar phosphate isomerase/epimerase